MDKSTIDITFVTEDGGALYLSASGDFCWTADPLYNYHSVPNTPELRTFLREVLKRLGESTIPPHSGHLPEEETTRLITIGQTVLEYAEAVKRERKLAIDSQMYAETLKGIAAHVEGLLTQVQEPIYMEEAPSMDAVRKLIASARSAMIKTRILAAKLRRFGVEVDPRQATDC